jgi:Major Facilitator Superfamily/Nuclease-related domain
VARTKAPSQDRLGRNRQAATLALLAFAMLIVSLDQYIVVVALPEIGRELGYSAQILQSVISAYAVVSGGFLLLGGRAADLLGRRRIFVSGLALYAGASLAGGLAPAAQFLLAARAVQGLGGALVFPPSVAGQHHLRRRPRAQPRAGRPPGHPCPPHQRPRPAAGRHRRRSAGGGGAGPGQRGPAGWLRPSKVVAAAGGRVDSLDPNPALADRRHPWDRRRRGNPWQPAGAPAGAGPRWTGRPGGRLGLRFQPSPDAVAWGRGAAGERRTARFLDPLERQGWAVLHDLAVPHSQANIDHLAIGPGGVFVIDSKQYRGRLQLDLSGRLWHGRYPLAPSLQAVLFEADQAALVLPDPDVVVPVVAVHGAQVPGARS